MVGDSSDAEVRRAFRPAGNRLEKSEPVRRVGAAEVDDVDDFLPFHGF